MTRERDKWIEHSCGKEKDDCWICRVKAKTIDCSEGEREYKGGCASVHTIPLDSHSAEVSCPGGGHLVSIHSSTENDLYKKFALDSGVSGTINIGGQFTNGKFEWNDGTNFNVNQWANSFPNTIFGNCVQMLLDSEFETQGQWTNIDCAVKQPYICFRDGSVVDPTSVPIHPKTDAKCPPIQYFTGSGTIFSPNYPLSIPGQQTCEYVLGTSDGTRANVKFPSYNCGPGTFLSLYDGLNTNQPFATFSTDAPSPNDSYSANSNVIKIVFSANGTTAPEGTGWEAEFTGI
ncbi:hypothetical protein PFISCL1PPCAC_16789 [Pristionchus fissidentatus]|uniref:CUB domain-containing protein n=1 Tax=Pristionchus fissidentatus TaxID=1538716 RepID=A0AAV5W0X4_9BILA|nr:hypothetical protein PFISCL1PPCAC_16789 [Pristionchus fissidentatus]